MTSICSGRRVFGRCDLLCGFASDFEGQVRNINRLINVFPVMILGLVILYSNV